MSSFPVENTYPNYVINKLFRCFGFNFSVIRALSLKGLLPIKRQPVSLKGELVSHTSRRSGTDLSRPS